MKTKNKIVQNVLTLIPIFIAAFIFTHSSLAETVKLKPMMSSGGGTVSNGMVGDAEEEDLEGDTDSKDLKKKKKKKKVKGSEAPKKPESTLPNEDAPKTDLPTSDAKGDVPAVTTQKKSPKPDESKK